MLNLNFKKFNFYIAFVLSVFMVGSLYAETQPSGNYTKPNPLPGTYFGDLDGDGLDEMIQHGENKIFAIKNNFERDGILHGYLPSKIKRLVVGRFAKTGRESGRDAVLAITEDGKLMAYSASDDRRTLWWWFTQANFIGNGEEALVGEFTGDGQDDILVYNSSKGSLRLYARGGRLNTFALVPNFELGNLSAYNLKNKRIYVGDFGQEQGRSDILIHDPVSGKISRYDCVTEPKTNKITFWWAFHTGAFYKNVKLDVGKIDNDNWYDVLVIRGTNKYQFFNTELLNGSLKPISSTKTGNLTSEASVTPIFGRFARWDKEPGRFRHDLMLFRGKAMIQMDARYDVRGGSETFWAAYTANAPENNKGWTGIKKDKISIVKCKFLGEDSNLKDENYYEKLFLKKGEGTWGLYRYLYDMSYGTVQADIKMSKGWRSLGMTLNYAKGIGHYVALRKEPYGGSWGRFNNFEMEGDDDGFYIKAWNKYLSTKQSLIPLNIGGNAGGRDYLLAGENTVNNSEISFYKFKREKQSDGFYLIRNLDSGDYMYCKSTSEGALITMNPILNQSEIDKYKFRFDVVDGNIFNLYNKAAQRYIAIKPFGRRDICNKCFDVWSINPDSYKSSMTILNRSGIDIGASGNRTVLNEPENVNSNVMTHEAMHNYSLSHSFDDASPPNEYDDAFDMLGSSPPYGRFDSEFDHAGPGIHALNRDLLGWLPINRIQKMSSIPKSPVVIEIAELNRPECNGPLMIEIAIMNGEKLFVEFRENKNWDQSFKTPAVYVRRLKDNLTQLQTNGEGTANRNGAQLIKGESFNKFGVIINVVEIDNSNGTAKLRISPAGPMRR